MSGNMLRTTSSEKALGGYFEWEPTPGGEPIHLNARLALKSGRSCVRCLLDVERPSAVWVPFYCCDALLEPFDAAGVAVKRYAIGPDLAVDPSVKMADAERIVVINYFGLQNAQIAAAEERWREHVWVDNTQAFFHRPESPQAFDCNSARKFLGVPDGGYLYGPPSAVLPAAETWQRNANYRFEHLILRGQGDISEGRGIFEENERRNGEGIERMSRLSEAMLARINFAQTAQIRRENFQTLHATLAGRNRLPPDLLTLDADTVPYCYPYLPRRPIAHRYLWDRQIFAPRLWVECAANPARGFEWEQDLARNLLPLPIDQRYGRAEMQRILEVLDDC